MIEELAKALKDLEEMNKEEWMRIAQRRADKLNTAMEALRDLAEAADVYQADQSRATDDRLGLVQPITVAEGLALSRAIKRAYQLIEEAKG